MIPRSFGLSNTGIGVDLKDAPSLVAARGGELGPVHLLAETTSTNDEAKEGAKSGAPHGSVWVAEMQTKGRGRQGRSWLSPRGENLLFSLLVRPRCDVKDLPPITIAAGLAVRDAIAKLAPKAQVRVKWPNDVVIGPERKKIAGILVEAATMGGALQGVIIGIGINVHGRDLPEEIRGIATSVALIADSPPHRAELLADVLSRLDHDVMHTASRGLGLVHARFAQNDALFGERVVSELGEGVARGVDATGRLIVELSDGTRAAWGAGEVHLAKGIAPKTL